MARIERATDNFANLSNWTQLNNWGAGNCTVSGNKLLGAGVGGPNNCGTVVWSGAGSFTSDQYAMATVSDMSYQSDVYVSCVAVRCSGDVNTSGAQMDFYAAVMDHDNSSGNNHTCRLVKVSNGTPTLLGSTVSIAYANGDTIEIEADGTSTVTLKFFKNGVEQFSRTDSSSPLSGGKPALIQCGSSVGALSVFSAGDLGAGGAVVPIFTQHRFRRR